MTFFKKFKDPQNGKLTKAKSYLNSVKIILRTIKHQLT